MTSVRLLLALLSVAVLAAACGTGSPGAEDDVTPTPAERDGDTPVLRVEHVGGFLPVGAAFAQVPQLSVYPDGRAITQGPQILVFPGPALPNLQVYELSDEQLDELSALAEDAGLLGDPPDYGQPPVADAPTTVVTLRFGSGTTVHEAEALSLGEGPEEEPLPGLDDEQRAAREELSQFVAEAMEVVESSGESRPYEVDAFAVQARPVPPGEATVSPEPDAPQPTVMPWPLPDTDLARAEDCLLVEDADADTLRDTMADATVMTRFEQDGQVYDVAVRPLLPGDAGCA